MASTGVVGIAITVIPIWYGMRTVNQIGPEFWKRWSKDNGIRVGRERMEPPKPPCPVCGELALIAIFRPYCCGRCYERGDSGKNS